MTFSVRISNNNDNPTKNKSVIIIGGGIGGLYAGWKLCKNGFNVTILDRQNFVGGFSASISFKEYKIDLGPHYATFPSESPITKDIFEIIGKENIIEIQDIHNWYRSFYQGKIINGFPTIYDALFHLGVKSFLQGFFSFLLARIKLKKNFEKSENYFKSLYGHYLFTNWCKPYLIQTIGTIDVPINYAKKRFKPITFKKVLHKLTNSKSKNNSTKSNIKKRKYIDCYFRDGIGNIINSLVTEIEKLNGKIILGADVELIHHDTEEKILKFSKDNLTYELKSDMIIYATPLQITKRWFNNLEKEKNTIKNSNFHSIMVFFGIDSPKIFDGWMLGVFDERVPFFRIAQQTFLTKTVAPPKKSLLSIEIRSSENDPLWNENEQTISKKVENSLNQIGLLKGEKIDVVKVLKFRNLYPTIPNSSDESENKIEIDSITTSKNEYFLGIQQMDSGRLVSDSDSSGESNTIGGIFTSIHEANNLIEKIISDNSN